MIPDKIFVIRQTDRVNDVAEKLGMNIVGRSVFVSAEKDDGSVRAYLVQSHLPKLIGPVLGLFWDDLDDPQ